MIKKFEIVKFYMGVQHVYDRVRKEKAQRLIRG